MYYIAIDNLQSTCAQCLSDYLSANAYPSLLSIIQIVSIMTQKDTMMINCYFDIIIVSTKNNNSLYIYNS